MKIKAPAKLNLFLEIRGKRKDGYHNLATLMQPVGLCDEIEISVARKPAYKPALKNGINFECTWPENLMHGEPKPPKEKNLAYRAAVRIAELSGKKTGIRIRVAKNIPAGSGMGGGSSDAAAVIKGLCKMLRFNAGARKIQKIASELGADVPFFLHNGCCLAEGIGEKITGARALWEKKPLWLVLVHPPFQSSTSGAYGRWDLYGSAKKDTGDMANRMVIRKIKKRTPISTGDIVFINDLERAVAAVHPEIDRIKKALDAAGAFASLMTGSGSAVFGIFTKRDGAISAGASLKKIFKPPYTILVIKTL
ncbi:MAG: 4-(cytidine 5'-diphospho)-2-C-methyl-D-erythritol kinase [Elusimicrobia bacterium]|nr:4-(cytidine 5'-diphospho)-2-C-methyl-D-erythritol kinase [Elusimicrobiota bacterium]